MCEITVPVNHYDVITFHWKSSANPRWNYTGNGRILRGSAAIRGGIKIFRGGIISGQVSGIAGGSEKSSAGMGGLVKIPLDCTVYTLHFLIWIMHAKMIEKVRQSVTTYIRRSIFITWFDQGGGVPCKYLTVRVDTTHWFIVRIMNREKQMLFHSYF